MTRTKALLAVLVTVVICGMTAYVPAQQAADPQQQQQGGRGNRPGRGNFDPAQWRQQRLDQIKQDLGSKDDEWQVLQPKVEKVMTLSMESRMAQMRNFGRRNSDRGGNTNNAMPETPTSKAMDDLKSALDDKSISPDEIAKRLATLRQVRDQAKADLTKAQAELKELLNQRQEAVLVMAGMLD